MLLLPPLALPLLLLLRAPLLAPLGRRLAVGGLVDGRSGWRRGAERPEAWPRDAWCSRQWRSRNSGSGGGGGTSTKVCSSTSSSISLLARVVPGTVMVVVVFFIAVALPIAMLIVVGAVEIGSSRWCCTGRNPCRCRRSRPPFVEGVVATAPNARLLQRDAGCASVCAWLGTFCCGGSLAVTPPSADSAAAATPIFLSTRFSTRLMSPSRSSVLRGRSWHGLRCRCLHLLTVLAPATSAAASASAAVVVAVSVDVAVSVAASVPRPGAANAGREASCGGF
mmetsp:Transcript_13005/g.28893  ORF Transcript_13005/g.28893 Transcript_13005/m.28893 type:complete len:280 (+) Transcript_13005:363-1202(+)